MSHFVQRQTAPERLRKLARDLNAAGIDCPAEVTEALDNLDRLDKIKPRFVAVADLIDDYASGATAKKIDSDTVLALGYAFQKEAWDQARIKVAQDALAALPSHGDALTTQLAELAAPLIETVTRTARIDTHDVDALVRAGRVDEATLVASYNTRCAELGNLYELRSRVTKGADYGSTGALSRAVGYANASCSVWRDPRVLKNNADGARGDVWRSAIQAGGEMWFPLPGEAAARSSEISAEVIAAEEAEARDMAARGFNTGLGSRRALVTR
jgi:hypothetical protein